MTDSTLRAETDKQIFVSYSRADRDRVVALYDELERLGFKLWRDLHEIPGGDDWWQKITDAIDASETMVLCISPTALKSEIVTKEWLYARQVGRRVIPVIVDDIDFSALPRWMQFTDMKDFRDGTPERDKVWGNFIHTLNTPYTPQKVPFMVEAPPFDYIQRPDVVEPIITSLQNPANRLIALKGAGGYGKTTLTRVVCHDQRVRTTYFHGTLWVTLGESVSEEERIQRLLDLVVELRGERPKVEGMEAAKNELRKAIGDSYVLLVVDDAWRRTDLESFLVDAPNAAVLVTTRIGPALPDKATDKIRIHDIDAMQPDQAVKLLAFELPPDEVARQYAALDSLAKRLGEWPLMIKLTNGALKTRMSDGDTLVGALNYVEKSLTRRGLSKAFADTEKGRNATAAASLDISLGLLKPDERTLYNRLAIFPEDVEIPLQALETLWEMDDIDTEDFAQRLFSVSLLLRFDLKAKIVRLHDIVRTYLRETETAQLPTLNADFLTRMQQRYGIDHWRDLPPDAPYLWDHLAYHLIDAGQTAILRDLLFDFGWMYAKLNATDPAALLADAALATSALKDDRELRLIESALRLAQNVLSQDKKQLANQIRGRLWIYKDKPDEYPAVVSLWHAVPDIPGTLALLPTQEFPPMIQAGGPLIRTLEGHTGSVQGAIQLKDGRILSWSGDGTLRLWSDDGAFLTALEGHKKWVKGGLQLTNDRLLSWSADHTLRLWSSDGTLLHTLEGHTHLVQGALELMDRRLLSWSDDTTLRLWDADGIPVRVLEGHTDRVKGALELTDRRLLSWSYDKTLRLWDADGSTSVALEGPTYSVQGAVELTNGSGASIGCLLSWSADRTLRLWDADGRQVRTLEGHPNGVFGVLELTSGSGASIGCLLSWADDRTLRLWTADGRPLRELEGHTDNVLGAMELQDGRLLSWSADHTLRLWDADGSNSVALEGHSDSVGGAVELNDGRLLSWSSDRTLRLWSENGTVSAMLRAHTDAVHAILMMTDGRLISWSPNREQQLWSIDGTYIRALSYVAKTPDTIFDWLRENDLDGNEVSLKDADPSENQLRCEEQYLMLHDSINKKAIGHFIGDAVFSHGAIRSYNQIIVAGDWVGRVIFLKIVPPEDAVTD